MSDKAKYKGNCCDCKFRRIEKDGVRKSRPNDVAPCETCGRGQTEYVKAPAQGETEE